MIVPKHKFDSSVTKINTIRPGQLTAQIGKHVRCAQADRLQRHTVASQTVQHPFSNVYVVKKSSSAKVSHTSSSSDQQRNTPFAVPKHLPLAVVRRKPFRIGCIRWHSTPSSDTHSGEAFSHSPAELQLSFGQVADVLSESFHKSSTLNGVEAAQRDSKLAPRNP